MDTADESAFTTLLETWPSAIMGTRRSRHLGGKLLGRNVLGKKGRLWISGSSWFLVGWDLPQISHVNQRCQEGLGAWDVEPLNKGGDEVVAALKELSGQVVPDQALQAFRVSYLHSNLDTKTSSWTRMSVHLQRDHSSHIGVERKPNWEEQMEWNSSFPNTNMQWR